MTTPLQKEVLFAHFPKATHKRYTELLNAFGSLERVWSTSSQELRDNLPWKQELLTEFFSWRNCTDPQTIAEKITKEKISTITIHDQAYPTLLKEIHDPPFCLFVRGSLTELFHPIGVVGTRKYSSYGKQVTQEIVSALAQKHVSVISGLALGIDSIAHESTLRVNGHTVAILGGGVDDKSIYPRTHVGLAQRIIDSGGALISEYPPGTLPTTYSFPKRNRIIAGMALGTLVIEAPKKSGSLITATCALESNRDVFAIPQNITSPTAEGPNMLIKQGAKPVTRALDILEMYHLEHAENFAKAKNAITNSPTEATILTTLSREPTHVDDLLQRAELSGPEINSTLTLMEMKGTVRNVGNMMYVITK